MTKFAFDYGYVEIWQDENDQPFISISGNESNQDGESSTTTFKPWQLDSLIAAINLAKNSLKAGA